jgi:non-ribosomal peptide synthetase component F
LDPEYPGERLSYMVEDAGVPLLLTQARVKEKLPSGWAQVICLDDEDEPWAEEGGEEEVLEEAAGVSGQNLAYIIYTSGSTGKPKGVSITHQGLTNYVLWSINAYLDATDGCNPVHSPLSFDLTVTSLFPSLLQGKRLTLLPEKRELETLRQILRCDEEYGIVKLTPSHLRALSEMMVDEGISGSGCLVIGGEALRWGDLSFWQKPAASIRLINE